VLGEGVVKKAAAKKKERVRKGMREKNQRDCPLIARRL